LPKQVRVAIRAYDGKSQPVPYPRKDLKHRLYPYGTAVIVGTLLRWGEKSGLLTVTPGKSPENKRWLWSLRLRFFSVITFLLCVAVVLVALGSRFAVFPLMITGLLLVSEPLNAAHSHYGMNDVPLTGILLLVWLLSWNMGERPGMALLPLLGGLLLGTGFGIKYHALVGLVFPGTVWLLLLRRRGLTCTLVSMLLFSGGFLAGALLTMPLLRNEPLQFIDQFPKFMQWQTSIISDDLALTEKVQRNLRWLGNFAVGSGLWALLPGAVWALLPASTPRGPLPQAATVSALLFSLSFTLVLVFSRSLMRSMDMMYLFPFLIILTGALADDMLSRRGGAARVPLVATVLAAGILAGFFLSRTVPDSLALTRPDTRLRAREWCRSNFPDDVVALRERWALPVNREGVIDKGFNFLAEPSAWERIANGQFDFLIATSRHDRFSSPRSPFHDQEMAERYRSIERSFAALAVFRDREVVANHPTITVYAKER
jgi:hypothetical protein